MSDLIDRQSVKEWLERWEGYLDKDMIARMQLKVDDIPTHPTSPNTLGALDCVERQAAMKIRFSSGFDHDGILFIPYRDVEEHLKNLSSVQPQTSTISIGRTKGGTTMWYECDACGEPIDIKDNFCRNCGRWLMKDE